MTTIDTDFTATAITPLWPHQQEAFEKLAPLGRGLLAMDVGTGKSLTALHLVNHWGCRRVLIVCPLSMVPVWPKEFAKHGLEDWSVVPLATKSTERRAKTLLTEALCAQVDGRPFAAVLNYDALISKPMSQALNRLDWDCVLLDESQKIKSATAKVSQFTADLARTIPHCVLLTGTPMHDTPLDVFGQFRTLDPSVFGDDYWAFVDEFAETELAALEKALPRIVTSIIRDLHNVPRPLTGELQRDLAEKYGWRTVDRLKAGAWPPEDLAQAQQDIGDQYLRWRLKRAPWMRTKVKSYRNLDGIRERMAPLSFFCSKRDVLDLPPVVHEDRYCLLGPTSRRAYEAMKDELRVQLENGEITAANAASRCVRLRQITNGFGVDQDGNTVEIGTEKRSLLCEVLEELPDTEQVAVIGWAHHDLDMIHKAAHEVGRSSSELSGRRKELETWQAGDTNVLVVQYDAGGAGVSFVNACYQVYLCHPYSLGQYEQTLGRIDRPGQTRPVTYLHLVALNTVDEQVSEALQAKRDVNAAILSEIKRKKDAR